MIILRFLKLSILIAVGKIRAGANILRNGVKTSDKLICELYKLSILPKLFRKYFERWFIKE